MRQSAELIGAVHIGIGIAGSPLETINDLDAQASIAGFGNNNGLILGGCSDESTCLNRDNLPDRVSRLALHPCQRRLVRAGAVAEEDEPVDQRQDLQRHVLNGLGVAFGAHVADDFRKAHAIPAVNFPQHGAGRFIVRGHRPKLEKEVRDFPVGDVVEKEAHHIVEPLDRVSFPLSEDSLINFDIMRGCVFQHCVNQIFPRREKVLEMALADPYGPRDLAHAEGGIAFLDEQTLRSFKRQRPVIRPLHGRWLVPTILLTHSRPLTEVMADAYSILTRLVNRPSLRFAEVAG